MERTKYILKAAFVDGKKHTFNKAVSPRTLETMRIILKAKHKAKNVHFTYIQKAC